MLASIPIRRVVLYKHGIAYLERRGQVVGPAVHLDFKAAEMNDVLKSLTLLDLSGAPIASVSYDATMPAAKQLDEVALRIPDQGSLRALLGQVKGARVRVTSGTEVVEGAIVGLEQGPRAAGKTVVVRDNLVLLVDGSVRALDLLEIRAIGFEGGVRGDLEHYLDAVAGSFRRQAKRVTIFTTGDSPRELFVSYVIEAPVWKASYRIMLEADEPPTLQGWAVIDNTGDEDWNDVSLELVAGMPVSFVHDLYQPRYVTRPVVEAPTAAGAPVAMPEESLAPLLDAADGAPAPPMARMRAPASPPPSRSLRSPAAAAPPPAVEAREIGDAFSYRIETPVTVRRNQSALVPILHRAVPGRRVLLFDRASHERHPMACVEITNDTELTLEGGPVTVLDEDTYAGEAMLETIKPADRRIVPFALELGCTIDVDDTREAGRVFRTVIAAGTITTHHHQYQRTRYRIGNKSPRPRTLIVDHPRRPRWDLVAPDSNVEETPTRRRVTVALPAAAITELVVAERTPAMSSQAILGTSREQVQILLSSGHVDERVAGEIRAIIETRARIDALQRDESMLEAERQQIGADQDRIRKNLTALESGAEQRQLAERLVAKLTEQEDRLEALAIEVAQSRDQRTALEDGVRRRIEALAFEADLGEPPRPA